MFDPLRTARTALARVREDEAAVSAEGGEGHGLSGVVC